MKLRHDVEGGNGKAKRGWKGLAWLGLDGRICTGLLESDTRNPHALVLKKRFTDADHLPTYLPRITIASGRYNDRDIVMMCRSKAIWASSAEPC